VKVSKSISSTDMHRVKRLTLNYDTPIQYLNFFLDRICRILLCSASPNPQTSTILETSNDDIVLGINFVFDSIVVVGDGRSNGYTSGCTKSNMAAGAILEISNGDISATDCLINFVLDSRCLLSPASEPHRLPACLL